MTDPPTVLITGAAGNLGGLLARHLIRTANDEDAPAPPAAPPAAPPDHRLRLMVHRTPVASEVEAAANVSVVTADLADPASLAKAVQGVDVVVHFAGVLFAPRPEKFLPETNTKWFDNLLSACLAADVKRVILISFPHTEGPTTIDHPATDRLDREPVSAHARTRRDEERLLMERTEGTSTTPVVLRLGMVYGRGILMVDWARWFARRRMLGVWREPTLIHLISTADYLANTEAAIFNDGVTGIFNVGDDKPVTLQHFLDQACDEWGVRRPWRMPLWLIYAAAWCCEMGAIILRRPSPLTRDFITIGRVPYWGDTTRARKELVATLRYPTFSDGQETL